MKLEKALRVMVLLLVGLFIWISIDFGIVLASTRSSKVIGNELIQNEKVKSQLTDKNDVESNYNESVRDHNDDFLKFNLRGIESEEFTPNLYEWLWNNPSTH
ncbi:MAG: hypothetical protein PHT07_14040 [Paludibacter sp.]|nr:hypothetical protein [Paludibacter sp.]